jgi:5-methylcytosine-specific restriction protein A
MPWRPRSATARPRQEYQRHARKTTERGYGADWQTFRLAIIRQRPLCEDQNTNHPGITKPSTEVHHLTKIKHAPDRRLDPTNVLALCDCCHDARTKRGQ